MTRFSSLLLLTMFLVAAPAAAEIQTRGPQVWPGRNEISGHLGAATGLANSTPGGLKLQFDYSRLGRDFGIGTAWFNVGFSNIYGPSRRCSFTGNGYVCGYGNNGFTLEPFVGLKLKFKTGIPLVPYVKIDGTFIAIVGRACGDNGVAFGLRSGGGLKYFLTRHIGLGIEVTWVLGPGIYVGPDACTGGSPSRAELYAGLDFLIGLEWAF